MSSNSKILIVDDDERVIRHISDVLGDEGYEISFSMNKSEAWESINNQQLDLVLLDVNLPDGEGYELCEKVHNNEDLNPLPIVFITGVSDNRSIEKAFEAGGEDYISKPISNRELLARVDKTITLCSLRQSLQDKVEERTAELQEKNTELQRMNANLEELLDRFENREQDTWESIHQEITDLVKPHLQRLESEILDSHEEALEYLELVNKNIEDIFEQRTDGFSNLRNKLTQREFEICSFIRKGLTSKEIASTLGRSTSTIKKHRKNIREKLDLKNKDKRLSDYLMELN